MADRKQYGPWRVLGQLISDQEADSLVHKLIRGTDSSPTADFTQWRNAADTTTLAKVDVNGKIFGAGLDAGSAKITSVANGTVSTDVAALGQIPSPSATVPSMNGVASAGSGIGFPHPDHVHPVDTTRLYGRVEFFGHSMTNTGSTAFLHGTSARVASTLGCEVADRTLAGQKMANHEYYNGHAADLWYGDGGWAHVYKFIAPEAHAAPYESRRNLVIFHTGVNDLANGSTATAQEPFANALTACISRARAAAVFEESDASVTYPTGTWSTISGGTAPEKYSSGTSIKSTASASGSVSIAVPSDFPGGAVCLSLLADPNGKGGTWSIAVDGGSATGLTVTGKNAPGTGGGDGPFWTPVPFRVSGLSAGAHTIVATVTPGASGIGYFDCWWIEALNPPLVGVCNMADTTSKTSTERGIINTKINAAIAAFDSSVFLVDLETALGTATSSVYLADGLHPNDRGHKLIAKTIVDAVLAKSRSSLLHAEGNAEGSFFTREPYSPLAYGTYNRIQPAKGSAPGLTLAQSRKGTQEEYLLRIEDSAGSLISGIDNQGFLAAPNGGLLPPNTTTTGSHSLPVTTVNVVSTTGFDNSGYLNLGAGEQRVLYTGKTATTFTGCSGGTGTITAGSAVNQKKGVRIGSVELFEGLPGFISFGAANTVSSGTVASIGAMNVGNALNVGAGATTLRSGASGTKQSLQLGRTANEVEVGIEGAAGGILSSSAVGDMGINIASASSKLNIGFNGTQSANFNALGVNLTGALTMGGALTVNGSSGIASAGDVGLTNGNVLVNTIGRGLRVKEGTNAKQGISTLAGGTVVVSNTSVTATSRIQLTCNVPGGTPGFVRVSTRTAGTSFTILSSSNTDTSQVAWEMFEPA